MWNAPKGLGRVPLAVLGLGVATAVHVVELYLWYAHKKSIYGKR